MSVLRISNGLLGLVLGCVFTTAAPSIAAAYCGPDKLGTSRTMKVSTSKFRTIVGHEKSFGLRHKEVILTFDDGPIAGITSRILKSLSDECVKATFFYVGRMAKFQPRLVRKVVSQGHTLGHHTHAHNRLVAYSSSQVEKHVSRGISTIEKIAYGQSGSTPRVPFFRYPYLARNNRTDAILRRKGLIAFDANIDSLDWKNVSADAVHNRIMRRLRKEGKGIVLMHDIQKRTAKMLPRLLRSLKREGYKIVHVVPSTSPSRKPDPIVVASLDQDAEPALKLPKDGIEVKLRPVKSLPQNTRAPRVVATLNTKPTKDSSVIELAALPNGVTAPAAPQKAIVETPVEVASLSDDQLIKPRTVKKKVKKKAKKSRVSRPKTIAGGSKISKRKKARKVVRRKKRKTTKVASAKWKLRRSQWILR